MIHNYIEEMFEHRQWLHKIVHITKQKLLAMNSIRYAELKYNRRHVSLEDQQQQHQQSFEFDFSNIKSFGI